MEQPLVRRLVADDADAYYSLRAEMLGNTPIAFLASPEDDFAKDPQAVREMIARGPEHCIFGAFAPSLQGAVGVLRERHTKASHKAHVWGVYVSPSLRGRGAGRALLQAAIEHARTLPGVLQLTLSVSEGTPAARGLYESLGFRVWGTEPDALRHEGVAYAEHYMTLFLDAAARSERGAL